MSILFTQVRTPGEEGLSQGYVAVSQGKISYVGENRPEGSFSREISCENKVLMPGLVNAHTHVPMTLLRGMGGGNNLQDWLHNHIFPAEARLTPQAIRIGTRLAIAELLACGVTCVADMYDFCEDIMDVFVETGMKGHLSRGVLCFDPEADLNKLQGFVDSESLLEKWQSVDKHQIGCHLSIHAEYTSNPKVWEHMHKFMDKYQVGLHIHVSETQSEHEECKKRYGKTPMAVLDDAHLWDLGGIAAHCVWTEESDWELMVKRGVSPVHNPISNLKLGSGVAPVAKMLEKGVNVCLGTDGVASNNNHDLWEEIKLTAMLHNGLSQNPTLLSSHKALELATKNGGIALGRKTGQVAEGYDADLILVDFSGVSMTPCHDMVENLVYSGCGRDVCLTMCGGKILYENGNYTTIDLAQVKKEVEEIGVPCILGQVSS